MPLKDNDNSLLHRSVDALRWNYIGVTVRMGLQFFLGILLARILGPEPFGIVAIAWLVLGVGNLVGDFGLASALVQQETITRKDIRYVFTMQMLSGLIMTLFIIFTAPYIAQFFKSPSAAFVIQVMGCLFLIQAAGQTSTSLLRRQLDFKKLQAYNVASYLLSYLLLGLPLALTGYGVWALVAAQLSQSLLYSLMVNFRNPHSWKPSLEADSEGMLTFGMKIMASNFTSWGISNLDSVIIGRVFGPLSLGLYNRGMSLVATPMNAFTSTLQGVLFPAYARVNGNIENSKSAYLASVGLVAVILVPLFATIAAIPHTFTLAVYGSKWIKVANLITPLALAMPVNAILAMSGPLMTGLGKAGMDAFSQGLCVLVLVPVVWLASNISLETVAWGVLAVYLLRAILVAYLAMRLVSGQLQQILKALLGPVMLGCVAAIIAATLDITVSGLNPIISLSVVLSATATATLLLLLWQGKNLLCAQTRFVLMKMVGKFPKPLASYVIAWGV